MTPAGKTKRSGTPSLLVKILALIAVSILFLLRGWAIGAVVAGLLFGLVLGYEQLILIIPGSFYEWVGALLRSPVPYIGLALCWPVLGLAWKPLNLFARNWRINLEQGRRAKKMRRYNQQAYEFTEAMKRISRRERH